MRWVLGVVWLSACTWGANPVQCGKLICSADQFCEHIFGGVPDSAGMAFEEPDCRPRPESCDGRLRCACLTEVESCAAECEDRDDGVHCTLALP